MTIDWNKYQAEALTTAFYPLERELDYTILGLCSEVADVAELVWVFTLPSPELKSELGDCFWYVAAVADAVHEPLQQVWDTRDEARYENHNYGDVTGFLTAELVVQSGRLAGLLKNSIRDDEGVVSPQRRASMIASLAAVMVLLDKLSEAVDTTSHAVTQANLNKLADRKQRGVRRGSGDNR